MKKILFVFLFIFYLYFNSILLDVDDMKVCNNLKTVASNHNYTSSEIIITLTSEESSLCKEYSIEDFSEIYCKSIEELTYPCEGNPNYKRIFKITLENSGSESILDAINKLSTRKEIYNVAPNYIYDCYNENYSDKNISNISRTSVFSKNWGYMKINADVSRDMASEIQTHGTRIGVIECGIDNTHSALNNIDIYNSKDFSRPNNDNLFVDNANGHGTQVAGIINATNVSNEMSGVCPAAPIVSLKCDYGANANSNGILSWNTANLVSAISYSQDKGIRILNCSFGFSIFDQNLYNAMSQFSGLIVCAAGNGYKNLDVNPVYPACFDLDNIITVGAMTIDDEIWHETNTYGSNYGENSVDIFAPGENIYTTTLNNNYNYVSATSFAAPYVSAVAAMLVSAYYFLNDNEHISTSSLKNAILYNVTEHENFENYCTSGGYLNAEAAFSYISGLNNTLTYTRHNNELHYVERTYGDNFYEEHNWVRQISPFTQFAIIPIAWKCDKCQTMKVS